MITSHGDPCYGLTRFMRVKFISEKTIELITTMTVSEVDVSVARSEIRAKQACPKE